MIEPNAGRRSPFDSWPAVGLLVVLFILCQAGFDRRSQALGQDHRVLDVRAWYTPAEARDLLDSLGERGRRTYAVTEVTLDLLFPAVYGGLFVALILNIGPPRVGRRLADVPVCGAAADWCENGLAAYLAWTFDGRENPVAWAAAAATLTKGVCFVLAVLCVAGGALNSIRPGSRAGP